MMRARRATVSSDGRARFDATWRTPSAGSAAFFHAERSQVVNKVAGTDRQTWCCACGFFDDAGMVSRLDLDGAYLDPRGFGVDGNVAVSKSFLDEDNGNPFAPAANEQTALSNVELGGMYQHILSPQLTLAAHAGLTLPTSDDDAGMIVNLLSTGSRIRDQVLAIPDTMWLRLGVTPTYQQGNLFVRGDVGFDIGLDNESVMGAGPIDPMGHVSVGVGYAEPRFAASAEVTTIFSTGTLDEDEDRFYHAGTISAEYRAAGRVVPQVALMTALDSDSFADVVTVTAGVTAGF